MNVFVPPGAPMKVRNNNSVKLTNIKPMVLFPNNENKCPGAPLKNKVKISYEIDLINLLDKFELLEIRYKHKLSKSIMGYYDNEINVIEPRNLLYEY